MKYIKPLSLILLGAILMLIISNTEVSVKRLNQHVITRVSADTSEEIFTKRFDITITPTKEWVPVDLFGGAPVPNEQE